MQPSKQEIDNLKEAAAVMQFARDPSKKITLQDAAADLSKMLDEYEWFYDVVIEGRALCVYVHMMGPHMNNIPDTIYGYQVKEGFVGYLTCVDKYRPEPTPIENIPSSK